MLEGPHGGGVKNVLTLNLMDGGKVTVTKTNIARLVEAGQATRFGATANDSVVRGRVAVRLVERLLCEAGIGA